MAFDKSTRNRLQKFVGDARKLLSEEFTQRLQNTYGLDPITGGIAELSDLPSLNPSEQQTAKLLRDTLGHYLAASHKADPYADNALVTAALDRIVREQAFTVLNRLAALRMAEARQFVMESISQGYQSKGFQLYQRIAGSALGETGQAYQIYLFSVFDELSLDLAVLFDRYSSQGRLFPRETVLLELLDLINHAELELLWAEDETVGWIYQFWNGREEIDKMRSASRVPRNSREMAVRNQFFTPRYVVEYLTDNTLGRLWYEMTQGETTLVGSCHYLVRRPKEVFLDADQQAPVVEVDDKKELSQEELLQQTVYIQHRPLKDPRDIKLLDPACGSMHFGLYAFDLFEKIYSEAWDIEASEGYEKFASDEDGTDKQQQSLHQCYESKENFLADVPRLIIEHNIHGVDIDPRAAQIAGLSLWLRAQKSWADNTIKPNQRPQVKRSNIVCAESMPGETMLLKEFTSQIQPRVLGQLVEEIFHKMQLAGEAGTLLKIEEEIQAAIDEAKSQKDEGGHWAQGGLFGENKWKASSGTRYNFDGGISEMFWNEAEHLILSELERYAESSTGEGSGQKRLFASDTAKGFAFIDLCRKRFDVVLMNPPFGDSSKNTKKYIDNEYTRSKNNLLACFMERGHDLSIEGGKIGAIVSRTGFYLSSLAEFRKHTLISNSKIDCHLDLGSGVLDAMVEVACSVFTKCKGRVSDVSIPFKRLLISRDKENDLRPLVRCIGDGVANEKSFVINQSQLLMLDGAPFVYWIPALVSQKLASFDSLEPKYADLRVGLQTGTDFRFLRLWWEVDSSSIVTNDDCLDSEGGRHKYLELTQGRGKWCFYSKIDKASVFSAPIHLVVTWSENGREIKAYHEGNGHSASKYVMSESLYFLPGFSYMLRSSRIIPYIVPRGVIPAAGRSQIYPKSGYENKVLMIVASNIASSVARFRGENFGGPKFQNSMVASIPFMNISGDVEDYVLSKIEEKFQFFNKQYEMDETAIQFSGLVDSSGDVDNRLDRSSLIGRSAELAIAASFSLSGDDLEKLELDMMESINSPKWMQDDVDEELEEVDEYFSSDALLSWAIGVAFGRFDIRYMAGKLPKKINTDPFSPLPNKSPGMVAVPDEAFHEHDGILTSESGHEHDLCEIVEGIIEEVGEKNAGDIRKFLNKDFFPLHLKQYSKSRRQAPIYWPLQTRSKKYTLWVYYPDISSETLYTCINNFIDPKLKTLSEDIKLLRSASGRGRAEDEELAVILDLEAELLDMRDELLTTTENWNPSLADGVQLNASPLWSLFQHGTWHKKLKKTWLELEKGKYDWSKVAYSYWPERVIKKCHQDRSIAIAHNVEMDLWVEVEVPAARGKRNKWVWQPKELSKAELDTYIQQKIAQR